MSNTPSGFDPFWMFRMPLSDDVNQRTAAPKQESKSSALQAVTRASDKLERDQPDEYTELLRSRRQQG